MSLLEPGQYFGEAHDISFGHTSTGKEQFCISFKIVSLEGKALKFLNSYRVLEGNTPEATEKVRSFRLAELDAVGFSWDTMCLPVTAKRVSLVVDIEQDLQGTDREVIKFINSEARGAVMKSAMGEGEKLAFQARMKSYAAAANLGKQNDTAEPTAITKSTEPEPWDSEDHIPA